MYAHKDDTLFVNLFAASTAEIKMANGRSLKMSEETRYPWEGSVRMIVNPEVAGTFTIKVRIPGWARGEVVPSDLYRFVDETRDAATLTVNARHIPMKLEQDCVSLSRNWRRGDVIELHLPMPTRRVVATQQVRADQARVAIQRGPIVYCAEWPDNRQSKVLDLALLAEAVLTAEFKRQLLNGVTVIKGNGLYVPEGRAENSTEKQVEFTAIHTMRRRIAARAR
jgi:uncharacterized protein